MTDMRRCELGKTLMAFSIHKSWMQQVMATGQNIFIG